MKINTGENSDRKVLIIKEGFNKKLSSNYDDSFMLSSSKNEGFMSFRTYQDQYINIDDKDY